MVNTKDEEMKDAEPASTSKAASDAADAQQSEPQLSTSEQLTANLAILEKAVSLKETRMISGRLLRQTGAIRHQLTPKLLSSFVTKALPNDAPLKDTLLSQLKVHLPSLLHRPVCRTSHLHLHTGSRLMMMRWTRKTVKSRPKAVQSLPQARYLKLRLMQHFLSLNTLLIKKNVLR